MNYKIEWKGSPNFRPQSNIKKKYIVFHWIVGRLDGATAHFQNPKGKVATNYGVGEGRIHQYVKDTDYAFGSGTTESNRDGISIEHEGGWMLSTGKRKVPSKKVLETSAWLCAKIAREHNLGELVPYKNAFPHNKFVNTQCPGSLDWESICKMANQINAAILKPSNPEDAKKYYTIVAGDSYWKIASKLLKTSNPAKIIKEVARLSKLNNSAKLFPGNKIRIK
jgi:nucleoid-associated protein YgaU